MNPCKFCQNSLIGSQDSVQTKSYGDANANVNRIRFKSNMSPPVRMREIKHMSRKTEESFGISFNIDSAFEEYVQICTGARDLHLRAF